MVIQCRVYCHVLHGEEDYKVRMTKKAIAGAEDEVLRLQGVLENAESMCAPAAAGEDDDTSEVFENPIELEDEKE